MKKLIIVTMIVACVALCAAVWPHGNAVEETPVPAAETAVSAKEATIAEIEEPATLAEKNGVKSLLTIKLSMLFYNDLTSMLNGWHGQEGEYVWRMSLFASPKQSAIVRIVQGPLRKPASY